MKPPTGTASSICRVERRSLKIVAARTRMQKNLLDAQKSFKKVD
jgi:hypothetical protein